MRASTHSASALAGVLACAALAGCGPGPAAGCHVLIGEPTYAVNGVADQGLNTPASYQTPQTSAQDGATRAVSEARSPLHIESSGVSVRGAGGRAQAHTLAYTSATSPLTVTAGSTCTLDLKVSTSLLHMIDGGGGIPVGVRIRDARGRAVADIKHGYKLAPTPNVRDRVDIIRDNGRPVSVANPGGAVGDRFSQKVTLAKGAYTLLLQMAVATQADEGADIEAAAEAALR